MSELASITLPHPLLDRVALVLAHTTWQATLILGLVLILRRLFPDAHSRYAIGVGSLAAIGLAPVTTGCLLTPGSVAGLAETVRYSLPNSAPDLAAFDWARIAVLIWAVGVLALALSTGVDGLRLRSLRRSAHKLEGRWLKVVERRATRLRIRCPRLVQSELSVSPILVGWLRPVIVLPVAVVLALPPTDTEALLVHELMHLKRRDHLVNLFQVLLEILLFYHPAVWYLSALVRQDREFCCDAVAAVELGDRRAYSRALMLAEGLRYTGAEQLAVAATGRGLVDRVRALAQDFPMHRRKLPPALFAGVLAVSVVGIILTLACARPHWGPPGRGVEASTVTEQAPEGRARPAATDSNLAETERVPGRRPQGVLAFPGLKYRASVDPPPGPYFRLSAPYWPPPERPAVPSWASAQGFDRLSLRRSMRDLLGTQFQFTFVDSGGSGR